MKQDNIEKLIELAKLTYSPDDEDALAALRVLNKKLINNNMSMDRIIGAYYDYLRKENDAQSANFKLKIDEILTDSYTREWNSHPKVVQLNFIKSCKEKDLSESDIKILNKIELYLENLDALPSKQIKEIREISSRHDLSIERFALVNHMRNWVETHKDEILSGEIERQLDEEEKNRTK